MLSRNIIPFAPQALLRWAQAHFICAIGATSFARSATSFSCRDRRTRHEKNPSRLAWIFPFGAGSGGRTRTMLPPRDFESRTSANSVIPAYERNHFTISFFKMQEFLSQKSICSQNFLFKIITFCKFPHYSLLPLAFSLHL